MIVVRSAQTKLRILEVTSDILDQVESCDVHVADIAEMANVAIQTIYYHFGSLGRLIAEAQASAYLIRIAPLHKFLEVAEESVLHLNESRFWEAVGDDVMLAWSYGEGEDGWKISRTLSDVKQDPAVYREFSNLLDNQFERWTIVLDAAKVLGWVNPRIDTHALVASCWAGSNGQAVFSGTNKVLYTSESMRRFWLEIAQARR